MDVSKEELLKKLEEISRLHKRTLVIQQKMVDFEPEDTYERKIEIPTFPGDFEDENERDELALSVHHTDDDAIEQMAEEFDSRFCPREPQKPAEEKQPAPKTALTDAYKKSKGWMPVVAAFAGICSLLSGGVFSGDAMTVILNIIIVLVCAVVIYLSYKKLQELKAEDEKNTVLAMKEYENRKQEQAREYAQSMQAYQSRLEAYTPVKADFIEKYTAWREVFLERVKEEVKIEEKLEADRQAGVKKIEDEEFTPVLNELTELNDLITAEYLPALDIIIDLLRSGRADSLKEAINLYEDIVYRERQLQLEREKEEQRKHEEALKLEAAERHHQEQMAFQKQQEYNHQQEVKQKQEADDRRHAEEMRLRETEERNRHREAQASQQKRCVWCAHKSTCRQQYYDGAYNCTGFTPKQ